MTEIMDAKPLEQCQSCRKHCICVLIPSAWFGTQQPLPTSGPLCPHCSLCLVQLFPPWLTPFSPSSFCSNVALLVGPFQTTIFKTEILSLIVSIKPVAYSSCPNLFFSFSCTSKTCVLNFSKYKIQNEKINEGLYRSNL